MELTKEQEREIERAVAILESGGIVAFPTETVYGLGADADNEAAVGKSLPPSRDRLGTR